MHCKYVTCFRFAESHKPLPLGSEETLIFQLLNNGGPVKQKGDSSLVPLSKSTHQVSLSTEFKT